MISSLSAYLIVRNEARDLPACLESIKGVADQIVVVDGGSTDGTASLCRDWGVKVYARTFDGFASQKQYALNQCTGEWALSIDADERLTPELSREIKGIMGSGGGPDGYYIPRHMYFLGRRLRHGGVGRDWVLRLFRREKGRYLDQQVHEQIAVNGSVRRLHGALDHYSYATLEEYLEKIPVYTALAASERWSKGVRFSGFHHLRPLWELFSRIVLKGAWLDGQPGLIYAALSSHAAWLRYAKLWELANRPHD